MNQYRGPQPGPQPGPGFRGNVPGQPGQGSRVPPRQAPIPQPPPQAQFVSVTCSICKRKRNVPRDVARQEGDKYVCMTCTEEQAQGKQP